MLLSKSLLPNSVCFSVGFSSVVIQGVKMILQGQQLHQKCSFAWFKTHCFYSFLAFFVSVEMSLRTRGVVPIWFFKTVVALTIELLFTPPFLHLIEAVGIKEATPNLWKSEHISILMSFQLRTETARSYTIHKVLEKLINLTRSSNTVLISSIKIKYNIWPLE